ncbi:MAG TPA: hypothetical protein VEV38_02925 [Candidatus Eremiobacteraceae bacterium]|nr:hypothetical protein [Candidatus Eremiobacteraceae bacterium]
MLNEINEFAPIITTLIIAATAIAALVQLRHMRAANHITAVWSVNERFNNPDYDAAMRYLRSNLNALMADPNFKRYVRAMTINEPFPDPPESYVIASRAANLIGNTVEALGNLIISGLVDREIFLRGYAWIIDRVWRMLEQYVKMMRSAEGGDGLWEDFEYLTVCSREWIKRHPVSYPKGAGRILPSYETEEGSGMAAAG